LFIIDRLSLRELFYWRSPYLIKNVDLVTNKCLSITFDFSDILLVKKPELRSRIYELIQNLYQSVGDLPFDTEVVPVASSIKHSLKNNGVEIGVADLLIGAIAVHHDLIVVTSNVKHFEKIEGLAVENWRKV
jgi:tRNA(fMet)-specific endonuclease VapC